MSKVIFWLGWVALWATFVGIAVVSMLYGCGSPLLQGRKGFDISSSQQTQLRNKKRSCERRGGKLLVRVDDMQSPPKIVGVDCILKGSR